MEEKLKQLHILKSITLTHEERGLLRAHAARIIMDAPAPVRESLFHRGVQHGLRIALSAMFFVVFVGGSVSAIADSALPGDPLYSFKINVNEEVKGAFLNTSEEKVAWQKNRIENRVSEIKTLAESKTLTRARQEKAEKAISTHVMALSKELNVLSDESPNTALTVTASLEESLKKSSASLSATAAPQAKLTTTATANDTGISDALKTVNGALEEVSKQEVRILIKEIDNIAREMDNIETLSKENVVTEGGNPLVTTPPPLPLSERTPDAP